MSKKLRRRKLVQHKRKLLSLLVITHLIMYSLFLPGSYASAEDVAECTVSDSEIGETVVEDSAENSPDEDKENTPDADSNEDQEKETESEEKIEGEEKEQVEEQEEEEEQEQEEEEAENSYDDKEEGILSDSYDEPSDLEEKESSPDMSERDGVYELTAETEEYFASLCFDTGALFPEGTSFAILPITLEGEEEGEDYQEYERLFSATAEEEEALIGFYDFSWDLADDALSEESLFLSFMLKDARYADETCHIYFLEEEQEDAEHRFVSSEDAEWEEGCFFLSAAQPGVYALTVTEEEEEQVFSPPPSDTPEETLEKTSEEASEKTPEPDLEPPPALEEEAAPAEKSSLPTQSDILEEERVFRAAGVDDPTVPRSVYRIHVYAPDLSDTLAHHAEFGVYDKNGAEIDRLTLYADNQWQTDWETVGTADSSYSVEQLGIYDSAGNDITESWSVKQQTAKENPTEYDHPGWDETDSMNAVGTYLIEYEAVGSKYLLAVADPTDMLTRSSVQYWVLTGDQSTLDSVPDTAIWNVIKIFTAGIRIRNASLSNYEAFLTTREIDREYTFAMVRDPMNNLSQFTDHHLTTANNVYLSATENGIGSVSSVSSATYLTVYRQVIFLDTVYASSVCFRHTALPPPVQNTTVTVSLTVSGNIGERDRDFSFSASVNGGEAVAFTLTHTGEYVLEEIPVGARVTVSMTAPGYTLSSSFNDGEAGEGSLTVACVPADGGTLAFMATREVPFNTGVRSSGGPAFALVLMAVFLSLLLQPLWKLQIHKIIIRRKATMKKAVSVFLALLVLLSFPVLIYADGDESGGGETPAANISPSFSVIYDLPNGSSLQNESPTFAVAVLENYTNPDNKLITIGIPTINSTGFTVPIVLPAYSTVGEYRYSITQNSGNILGVTYDEDPILFCVLVGYDASDNMGVLATSVDSDGASSGKKVRFENELSSELLTGTLTVKNNVTGNVGDRTEALPITVTLETPANKTVQNTISYSVPNSNTLSFIEAGDWADSTDGSGKKVVSVTINLKHLDSVSFSDIPAGVGFSVTQSGNTGYTQSADPSSGSIASDETTVEVTNELNTTLSHGIVFQSTGYVLVIVIAAAGLFFLLFGKRRRDN